MTELEKAIDSLSKVPLPGRPYWHVRGKEGFQILINPKGKPIAAFLISSATENDIEQVVLALNAVEELLKGMGR